MTQSKITKEGPNPSGLCMCGCGRITPVAHETYRRKGIIAGYHTRYVFGHHGSRPSSPYVIADCGYADGPCWIWQWGKAGKGYGRLVINGKFLYAHRVYYEQAKGPIPPGYQIDHLCRNIACVNPDHLEAVTPAENSRRGQMTRLTIDDVKEIRMLLGKFTFHALAKRYGVSAGAIAEIAAGRNWKDIEAHTSEPSR